MHSPEKVLKGVETKRIAYVGPGYVVMDITNACNCNCIACWTFSPLLGDKKPDSAWFKQELSFNSLKQLIADLHTLGTKEVRLTGGGEPFMHPQVMEVIRLIKAYGLKCDVTTNFTLVNKEKIKELVELGVDNLCISLWAASAETYKKTHPNQSEEAFFRIKENLKYLSNLKREKNTEKPKTVIANVIFNMNYKEVEDMVKFAIEIRADEVYFTLADVIEGATESLLLNKEQRTELLRIINGIKKKGYAKKTHLDNFENFERRVANKEAEKGMYDSNLKLPCYVGWLFARIMANGNVAPCCRAVMIPSGNINEERFVEIWNNKNQQEFREHALRLDPRLVKTVGCNRICDNFWQNVEVEEFLKKRRNLALR